MVKCVENAETRSAQIKPAIRKKKKWKIRAYALEKKFRVGKEFIDRQEEEKIKIINHGKNQILKIKTA